MGKTVDFEDKITNRSIGFSNKQIRFFYEHPDFKPDKFCRLEIDKQIKIIGD